VPHKSPAVNGDADSVPTIVGAGLVALDLVFQDGVFVNAWAGGTCANVLAILSFLGWHSYPIARLETDAAGDDVRTDLRRWRVHLDFVDCPPPTPTPIVVERLTTNAAGQGDHRFLWTCPRCGAKLPRHQAITDSAMSAVAARRLQPRVFFMDRISPVALTLAADARAKGALVVWELAAEPEPSLRDAAFAVAHVLKYAVDRSNALLQGRPGEVCLEICTLGSQGLRFRSWLPNTEVESWTVQPSFGTSVVVDSCGAGDWCTAGVLAIIGRHGYSGFENISPDGLLSALRCGQAMAAWSCRFVGARGGMYGATRTQVVAEIDTILEGDLEVLEVPAPAIRSAVRVYGCAVCRETRRTDNR
jgi:sugar/nucleoside kinase (ribokinase family)